MNTNCIISLPVAVDLSGASKENLAVKLTATGVDVADAADFSIGTLRRGNLKPETGTTLVGMACAVYLSAGVSEHFVQLGDNVAVAPGDELERAAGGTFVKLDSGTAAAIVVEGAPANSINGSIRALIIAGV